jgi:hypothetical protein
MAGIPNFMIREPRATKRMYPVETVKATRKSVNGHP